MGIDTQTLQRQVENYFRECYKGWVGSLFSQMTIAQFLDHVFLHNMSAVNLHVVCLIFILYILCGFTKGSR